MYNIIVVGDSIAAGRKVEKSKSWPMLLAKAIDEHDKDLTLVHNLSIPGDRSSSILDRLEGELPQRCRKKYPDDRSAIIFSFGINDAKRDLKSHLLATPANLFTENCRLIADIGLKYADKVMFIGLTPINEESTNPSEGFSLSNIDWEDYNNAIKTVCLEKELKLITLIGQWGESETTELLLEDGIHPNELGHKKIFDIVRTEIL
ncbi:MAG: GDSL-type esterase/lipase family protein [Patescibacteria group bacterium]